MEFLVINPTSTIYGHPLILGQLWLATTDAYIGCHARRMTITQGNVVKNIVLYPTTKPILPIVNIQLHLARYLEENTSSPLTLEEAIEFRNKTEGDAIKNFINKPISMSTKIHHQ